MGAPAAWAAALLTAGAVTAALRWLPRRVDSLGRARRFPAWTVALLLAAAAACAVPEARLAADERALSQAASRAAGQALTVRCQRLGQAFVDTAPGELGWVAWGPDGVPERRTLIKRDPCRELRGYLRDPAARAAPTDAQVVAVHVLSHEIAHMLGQTAEALAECDAVQADAVTARALGASPGQAAALAGRYWRGTYPRMPDGYRHDGCRPGGPLDKGGPDPPWAAPVPR